jgi:hypothetical protein
MEQYNEYKKEIKKEEIKKEKEKEKEKEERNTGVEPAFQAWEARALPMC